jgi:hypothetical protein
MYLSQSGEVRRPQWVAARPGVLGLYAFFACVTLADSLVTGLAVSAGVRELMPVTNLLIGAFGVGILPLTKLPVLMVGAAAVRGLPWRWACCLIAVVSAVTALAVVWDAALMYHLTSR